jgi:APA family basic amino acid/polyamine antiporter
MQKEHPDWERPYKLPGGNAMRYLALMIAVVICAFTAYGQAAESWLGFAGYMGVGLVLWVWMMAKKWPQEKVWMMTPDGEKEF